MKHWIEYALVRLLLAVVRIAPHRLVRSMGTTLGLVFYTVDGAHRRIAERNLAAAFPARSAKQRRTIAREAFKHFGRLLFALLKFSTLTPEQMIARVDVECEERS